jgi:hypothetical protein
MPVAENLGERFVSFANVGPSVLDGLAAPSSADDVRGGVAAGTAAGEKITIRHLPLDEIGIGPRHRHDMGDLQVLADSMNEIGLLQPIGVTAGFTLVFGERRLRAARMLGWTIIAARIVDLPSIVAGEYAENEVRKDFTPSERVAIAEAIRAEMGDRRGSNQYVTKERPENFPDAPIGAETRVIAARKAGFGNETTCRQARTVVEGGAPNVVAAMDAGEVSISAAARVGPGDWLVSRHLGLRDNTAGASPPLDKAGLQTPAANRSSRTGNRPAQNCALFRSQTGRPVSRNYAAIRACSQFYDKLNLRLSTTARRLT